MAQGGHGWGAPERGLQAGQGSETRAAILVERRDDWPISPDARPATQRLRLYGRLISGNLTDADRDGRRIMPRIQETPPDRLSDAEVEALLSIPEPKAFVIRLGLGTGLRWAELCNARREQVRNGFLVVTQTKSSRLRRVPLAAALEAEIMDREGPLVPYSMGSTSSFSKFVRRHSAVQHFHVHQLRHYAASRIMPTLAHRRRVRPVI